jgi:hypothetical protein
VYANKEGVAGTEVYYDRFRNIGLTFAVGF